jgi:asparagine synthetase A
MQHATPFAFTCGTGVNDELDGIIPKSAVQFKVPNRAIPRGIKFDESAPVDSPSEIKAEIVQSLAKWKRIMLDRSDCRPGEGIYCDSTSVRKGYHTRATWYVTYYFRLSVNPTVSSSTGGCTHYSHTQSLLGGRRTL